MIWKTSIPYLLLLAMTCCILAILLDNADASQARYQALKSMEGWHEKSNRKAIQSRIGVNPSRVPWCGYAVAYSIKKAGGKPPANYASGNGYVRYGKAVKLSQARKGDIVTVRSSRARSGSHVGIFSHKQKGRVCLIGGNQSNRVQVSCYRAASVRSVRR
jgi:uncharacterized protein (TIGR02594 family)